MDNESRGGLVPLYLTSLCSLESVLANIAAQALSEPCWGSTSICLADFSTVCLSSSWTVLDPLAALIFSELGQILLRMDDNQYESKRDNNDEAGPNGKNML